MPQVHDRNSMASAIAMALKNRSLYKQDGISTREELQSYHDPEKSNNVDSKKPNLIDLAPEVRLNDKSKWILPMDFLMMFAG